MIEAQVPMDIRKVKGKVAGGLTLRQLVCIAVAAVVDIVFLFCAIKLIGIPSGACIYIVVLIDVPIMAFSFEYDGLPMEQFLSKILLRYFRTPSKRKCSNVIHKPEKIKLSDKEKKAREKKVKKLAKANPGIKAI